MSSDDAPRRLGQVPAFDGVRGAAVLLVVWYHAQALGKEARGTMPGGFLGVDAFFVLSGFLITALLLREQGDRGRVRIGAFYRRRALRLLPVVVAFVVAHFVFAAMTNLPAGRERSSALAVLLYYANWKIILAPPIASAMGHLWSLAVEEQFYLVWPFVMMVVTARARLRTVLVTFVSAIVLVAVVRAARYSPGDVVRLYSGTESRVDTLLVGALLAHLWVRGRIPRRGLAAGASVFVVVFAICARECTLFSPNLYRGGYTALAIGFAVVLAAILESSWWGTRVFGVAPLRAIGRVSYGLYVWHPLVFAWVLHYTSTWRFADRLIVALATTAVVTYASWRLIEVPFLHWKDRIEQRERVPRLE